MSEKKKESFAAIYVWAILLILPSLLWLMGGYAQYSFYAKVFDYLSEQKILLRFCFSVLGRVLAVVFGVGLLFGKDFFRKASMLLCGSTIVSLPWKHPWIVCDQVMSVCLKRLGQGQNLPMSQESLVFLLRGWLIVADFLFAALFIWFFSRPHVKKHFK